jgi:hypothetical protein
VVFKASIVCREPNLRRFCDFQRLNVSFFSPFEPSIRSLPEQPPRTMSEEADQNPPSTSRAEAPTRGSGRWLWRIYAGAYVFFLAAAIYASRDARLSPAFWLVGVAGATPLFFLARSVAAFPGRYSLLGASSRTTSRMGIELLRSDGGGGSIAGVRFERLDWRLHQYGLEIRVPGAGWGFVPAVALRSVSRAPRGVLIEHWSSEIRSPIVLESSGDLSTLLKLWTDNRPSREAGQDANESP